jgi:hypothetical protein
MDSLFTGALAICSNHNSDSATFVAVNHAGDMMTWSSPGGTIKKADYTGSVGDMKMIAVDVDKAFCSRGSYAAIGTDTSASSWPTTDTWHGGDSRGVASKLTSGIVDIFMTEYAFAALTDKGGLVVWGNTEQPQGWGGDPSSVSQRQTVANVQKSERVVL